jgi:protein-S-isoprenylcysteine O-methyltransferase Ste14
MMVKGLLFFVLLISNSQIRTEEHALRSEFSKDYDE